MMATSSTGGSPGELVSAIVPVYNGATYLAECIDSLLSQDHPAVEVIVVDDGSTDESADIAAGYDAVTVLRRPHEGLGAARNAGLDAARGEFIGWCDADDVWYRDKTSRQLAHFAEHPDLDIVLCRMDTVFEEGVERPDWLIRDQVYGDYDGIAMTSGLFRRRVFDTVRFRTDMPAGTDWNFLVQCRAAGFASTVLDEALRTRRIHDRNMTTDTGAARPEMFITVREHLRARRAARR